MTRIRIGLFGAGRIGTVHAANLAAHPRLDFVVACDPVRTGAEAIAERYNTSVETAADRAFEHGLDAVVIASSTSTHLDLLTAADEHDVAALCEKPIDLDLARVRASRERLSSSRSPIMVGFNRRFDPSFEALRMRVRRGDIGNLEQLVIISRDPAPPPEEYIAVSGGIFRDQTIHDLDTARSFVPAVRSVHAAGANVFSPEIGRQGDHDSATLTLTGEGGELITIINSRHSAFGHDQRIEAFGSEGMLQAGNLADTTVRHFAAGGTETADPYVTFFLERYAQAYRRELDVFVQAIDAGARPSPGYDDGLAALELADAAAESVRTGATIHLPAKDSDVRS